MSNSFVKVKKVDIEKALANHKQAYEEAKLAFDKAIDQSKKDKTTTRTWIFFKKTITVYEKILSSWCGRYNVPKYYPHIVSQDQVQLYYEGLWHIRNLKVFLECNPNEIYLDYKDTAEMVKWRDYV